MAEQIDYNKIAADLIQKNLEKIIDSLPNLARKLKSQAQIAFKTAFRGYMKQAISKYSKIKTILYRDHPVYLYDFYVPLDIYSEKIKISSVNASKLFDEGNFFVITSTAGSGKSTLFKHLFLDTIKNRLRIPIFIELRTLNNTSKSIIDQLYDTLKQLKFNLEKKYLNKCLTSGVFAIFLDGFDELQLKLRPKVSGEIAILADKYPENCYIVSSRPDNQFISWDKFTVLKTRPLDKGKACDLIKRLDYDKDTKKLFIKGLSSDLYDKHTQFLSNPLLLTIMLMCYHEYAEIPNKKSLFYSQAFEALYCKHDATKSGYRRQMHAKLAIDDFAKVLSCFCILTHSIAQVTFDQMSVLEYLDQTKNITGILFKKEDYLQDLIESVCILMPDGINITFTHRSFQEYFAAKYIASAKESIQKKLLNREFKNFETNEMLSLLLEIDLDLVETEILIPRLESILDKINYEKGKPERNYCALNRLICDEMRIEPVPSKKRYQQVWSATGSISNFLRFLRHTYSPRLPISSQDKPIKKFMNLYSNSPDGKQFTIRTEDLKPNAPFLKDLMSIMPDLFYDSEQISSLCSTLKKNQKNKQKSINDILLGY